jgi:nucleoside-diphosphate-sugar epimerase
MMNDPSAINDNITVLVTGGSGFLGKAIVRALLDNDTLLKVKMIKVLDISAIPLSDPRVSCIKGDVRNYNDILSSCEGCDLVIHSAAIVDWGTKSDEEILAVNYGGTKNVIKACKESGVKYLIYTSSLDAVYSGKPLRNVDENHPYPARHETTYCKSKYLSEKLVLDENSEDLKTCVLRPSDIYGEDDPYHIGSLINMAKGGFYIRLGDGTSKCQHVYVENMAYAHILAANELLKENSRVTGQVYFITDGPGYNFFKFFDQIIIQAGYKIWPRNLWLPRGFAYFLASISELIALIVRPLKRYYPRFSRFAVTYTCTDFTFTSEKAKRDFGYHSKFKEQEAINRTVAFYKVRGTR